MTTAQILRKALQAAKKYGQAREQGLDSQAKFWLAKYEQYCKQLGTDPLL